MKEITLQSFATALAHLAPALAALFIFIFGVKIKKLADFRRSMISSLTPALIISLIYYLGYFIGTLDAKYLLNGIFGTVCMFFTIVVGLALARSIYGYEPLPVAESFVKKRTGHVRYCSCCCFH